MAEKFYSKKEEMLNVYSHGLGFLLSLTATFFLVKIALARGTILHLTAFGIYGLSMVTLYAASTLYHSAKDPKVRRRLRVFDHASIYVLIAGTYTPFTLTVLHGPVGWSIFGISWTMALTGIILKLFFTGKYNLVSTLMYVFMGWVIIFAIKPLANSLSSTGLFWLAAGGLFYTFGALLYGIKRIKFNHAIFHIFVLLGSASHFIAVYRYIL